MIRTMPPVGTSESARSYYIENKINDWNNFQKIYVPWIIIIYNWEYIDISRKKQLLVLTNFPFGEYELHHRRKL